MILAEIFVSETELSSYDLFTYVQNKVVTSAVECPAKDSDLK